MTTAATFPYLGRPGRYAFLVAWLRALPAEQQVATLTLGEIEAIIGGALPLGSLGTGFWSGSTMAKRYWKATGFRAQLLRQDRAVEFRRVVAT